MRCLQRFATNESGNVLMLTALGIFLLVASAGAGIDLGRQQMLRIKLQQAADAAALSAASMPEKATAADRRNAAVRFFNLNFPTSYLGVGRPTPQVAIGSSITVSANAAIDTKFMGFVGVNEVNSRGRSVVALADSQPQVYDIILALDNSTRMREQDIGDSAYREPNAPRAAQARRRGSTLCRNARWETDTPAQCMARDYGLEGPTRLNAMRAATVALAEHLLKDNEAGHRLGGVGWGSDYYGGDIAESYEEAETGLDEMFAYGFSNSTAGLTVAGRAMATRGNKDHVRVIILLTSGVNTISTVGGRMHNGQWRDLNGCNGEDHCLEADRDSIEQCEDIKNRGVLLYTVAFGQEAITGPQAALVKNFLQRCASGSPANNEGVYYFPAGDGATLQQVFSKIMNSVESIRITE